MKFSDTIDRTLTDYFVIVGRSALNVIGMQVYLASKGGEYYWSSSRRNATTFNNQETAQQTLQDVRFSHLCYQVTVMQLAVQPEYIIVKTVC